MSFRTFLMAWAFSGLLLTAAAADDDIESRSKPAWISFAETPVRSNSDQVIHTRATKNADPKLLRIVSAFVAKSTDLKMRLVSYSDAKLEFRTGHFLVAKIADNEATFTTNPEFPKSVLRLLSKRFRAMGFSVEMVAPEELLERNENASGADPEFIVPYKDVSPG